MGVKNHVVIYNYSAASCNRCVFENNRFSGARLLKYDYIQTGGAL